MSLALHLAFVLRHDLKRQVPSHRVHRAANLGGDLPQA